MKKILSIIFILLVCLSASSADFTGKKIYINPGHGGYDAANDRNVVTIPYAANDTLGFWESKSNLRKGLALRDMLQTAGATVFMSRTQNRDVDDRALSQVAAEANANGVDAFLSIHSNASGVATPVNYLLLLYHGRDNQPTIPVSATQAAAAWPRMIKNDLTIWTSYATSTNIRGDTSFYGYGLGVLTPLTVPGFLSEGSFHDYKPEAHRLLNKDYCKLEATRFYRYFCDYFQADLPSTGIIAGYAKSSNEKINNSNFTYVASSDDQWLPLNGAKVKLMNATGDSINSYQVDSLYNGVFAFYNLTPGSYKLRVTATNHTTKDSTITVAAATTTYTKMLLANPSIVVPKDSTPNYPDPTQEAGAIPMNKYNFGTATPVVPSWLNRTQIKRVLYRNEKLYILTTEPKLIIANAVTGDSIREMKLTGISGGLKTLNDIGFTADGYLLGCNKDTVSLPETKGRYFKVYTWENDTIAPSLFLQTQSQGNWSNGIMGETMAVSGSRWKCSIFTSSVTSGSSKQIRIVGLSHEDGITTVGYKYMKDVTNYTEALWGQKYNFTISPTGNDYFVVDGEKVLPTEYQFDWSLASANTLMNKKIFAETSGYTLQTVASGISFFRNAKHVYMASPVCAEDSTAVGVVMFDITNGLDQAVKVSEKLPEAGLGIQKATYMAAAAKVSGYDIELLILAQNQALGRYKTTTPAATANVYASELRAEAISGGYNLKFTLNGASQATTITIMDGTEVIKTIDAGALAKGTQSITFQTAELSAGTFTWKVKAVGGTVDRPVKISDDTQTQMQFYSPRGVAVDNSFNSEYFGRIYASETAPGAVSNRTTKDGIYILNSALQDITSQGADSYAGGITWGAASSPMRVSVGEDGKVFLTDWSDAHPGVWIMDPANPTAAFTPVFSSSLSLNAGLASIGGVNVHGAISHCWVTGTGENRKLYTFDRYYTDATVTNTGNVLQYNIGNLTSPWQSAPSAIIYNDASNGNLQQNFNSCIAPDANGGWWISQYRATDAATIPSLIHIKSDGTLNFNSGSTPTLIANSVMAGMAVSSDGTRLAMGCQNEVKVFSVNYSETGVPTLTRIYSIKPAMGTNTVGLSFDRAGNLYVISNSNERLGVWALPKSANEFETPAPASQPIVVVNTSVEDVNNPAEIVSVFPNPSVDFINVKCIKAEIISVAIFDIKGSAVYSTGAINANTIKIPLSGIQSGIYLLKVTTSAGTTVKRIMKK